MFHEVVQKLAREHCLTRKWRESRMTGHGYKGWCIRVVVIAVSLP